MSVTDILATAVEAAQDFRAGFLAVAGTYRRASDGREIAVTDFTRGRSVAEVIGPDGVGSAVDVDDFICAAASLTIDGDQFEPSVRDQVDVTDDDGNVLTFEVMTHPPEPCFRYTEANRREVRIHTKHVKTTAASSSSSGA